MSPYQPTTKLPPFTGKESWNVWYTRFQLIADRSHWNDNKKLDEILPKLQGSAGDFVFSQLDDTTSHRDQHNGESVEEYTADLKRLYNKAHPSRDHQTREETLSRWFVR